jgi:hypothetical protein
MAIVRTVGVLMSSSAEGGVKVIKELVEKCGME